MAKIVLEKDDDMFELSSVDMSDDGIEIKKALTASRPRKVPVKRPQPAMRQQPPMRRPKHLEEEPFDDNTFEMFSNPQKAKASVPQGFQNYGEEDGDDNGDDAASVMSSIQDDYFNGEPQPESVRPSNGFATLDEEKQDLIYKFHRLEEKGFKISKRYNINSDILEMRAEFNKVKRDIELKGSLKFSRRMLMACVSGIEFLNKTYDPFTLELNGWSENVMENLNDGDYDNVFERLHDKYTGRVNAPPEMELMLSLAGSALMFHITSSMFKNMPNMGNNAEMMNMVKSMAKTQQAGPSAGPATGVGGPSMDFSTMQNMFSAFQPPQSTRQENNDDAMSDDSAAPSDMMSSIHSENLVRNVAFSEGGTVGGRRRGRKSKIVMSKENTINI